MITVVIPTRDAEATIERTLDSVLTQWHDDLEVIISDDGSVDGTIEIARFHARRDQRVRLLQNERRGFGAACNAALAQAAGEWITFLHTDDELVPKTLAAILERVGARPVDLVIFSAAYLQAYIYAWPPTIPRLKDEYFCASGVPVDAFVRERLETTPVMFDSTSNKLYSRRLIVEHAIRFPEDGAIGERRIFNYGYLRRTTSLLTMSEKLFKHHYGLPALDSPELGGTELPALLAIAEQKLELFRDWGFDSTKLDRLIESEDRRVLAQLVGSLLELDRVGGRHKVKTSMRELLAATPPKRYLAAKAAASRRERLFQLGFRTRRVGALARLIHRLRLHDDRKILAKRAPEIDRDDQLDRLGLVTASERDRSRYYFLTDYEYFLDRINPERSRHLLNDKAILLRRLAAATDHDYLRRDWLDLRRATFEQFRQLLEKTERVVAKPLNGRFGQGIEIIDSAAARQDSATLYEQLCQQKQYILEEYLKPHPDLERVYDGAVAAQRIHTLNLGGDVQVVLLPTIKFGSAGGVTSDEQGIQAIFDPVTGVIVTDGMRGPGFKEEFREIFTHHPDSGVAFQGFALPFPEETMRLVTGAARQVPELPFIGWDVACTADGPLIIEGNAASLIYQSMQVKAKVFLGRDGMRNNFEQILRRYQRFQKRQRRLGRHAAGEVGSRGI